MGRERDILRTGVVAVIAMEMVAIGMEMVGAMEMDTVIQKVVAVILMATDMERPGMEEVPADTERAGVQMMAGMEKAGRLCFCVIEHLMGLKVSAKELVIKCSCVTFLSF